MELIKNTLMMNGIEWAVLMFTAMLVGFAKTGIGGVTMLAIPLMATVFGGKESTGIILPMLIMGDLFAIWIYRKNVLWKNVLTPLPWAVAGILLGAVIGNLINDQTFLFFIGVIVLLCLALLLYGEWKGKNQVVPTKPWFYISVGILSGFASMIGNAAGPIFSLYLLALGLRKNNFMGTNAWFFFMINIIKLPFQIFLWHNIGLPSLILTPLLIPVITLGAIIGFNVLKKINEKVFRRIILAMTLIAAIRIFL
ncbi:MAG: hypothetical protein K0S55_343 [Clostridia bacterium]|nr:hypothetical protein [Clostridia bacterium]